MKGRRRTPLFEPAYRARVPSELKQIREDLRQLALELSPRAAHCPTFAEFAPRWLEEHARANRQKPRTIESKETILRRYILPRLGSRRLDDVHEEDIQQLKASLAHLSAKTANNILCVLNRMLGVAVRWRVIRQKPVTIEPFKTDCPDVDFYEFDEYAQLVAAARGVGRFALVTVLLGGDAGLRRGEMLALEWGDIDWRRGLLRIERSLSGGHLTKPKGGRARRVPATLELLGALRAARHHHGNRVLVRPDGQPATRQTLRTWMAAAQKEAKLRKALGCLHVLRHTFCSHLAMRGAPPLAIKELAGHISLRTTLRYMHLAPSEARKAIELLNAARHGAAPIHGGPDRARK